MQALLLLLSKHWVGIAIAAAVAGTYGYVMWLEHEVTSARLERDDLDTELTLVRLQLQDVTQDAEHLESRAQQAKLRAQQVQAALTSAQRRLREAKVPTECPAAVQWLVEEVTADAPK